MRNSLKLMLAAAIACTAPAYAHPGTSNIHQHFYEHILIAMMIGIPLVFGLAMFLVRYFKSDK